MRTARRGQDEDDSAGRRDVADPDDRMLGPREQVEPEGVEMLHDRYAGLAYALVFRVLNDPGTAEDVVQEAFLSIWRHASTYRSDRG
jgi:RNA polymerase sigma-70 factor (ECF subfamily)